MTNKLVILATAAMALASSAALAGNGTPPVQVSEPGLIGLFAGGVVLALAIARRARR